MNTESETLCNQLSLRENHIYDPLFYIDQQATDNAMFREDMRFYYDRQQEIFMKFTAIILQIRQKHIKSYGDLVEQDKETKKALVELAQQTKPIKIDGNSIAFFGLTSTGKSTFVNALLGMKIAETGVGETTKEIKPYPSTGFTLWDVPGRNDEIAYITMEYISFFKGLTKRLILIQATVKENSSMMKLLDEINLQYDIVVNKFDTVDEDERGGFKGQIQREIETLNLKKVNKVFFVSAKYPEMFPDWLAMVNYLTN